MQPRSKELDMPEGSILLNQMEYILEVLLKFEPSLQLKTRTTPGNQESFSPSSTTSQDQTVAEYLDSLQMLIAEDIIDAEAATKPNPRLHYNSDQVVVNLPAIVGCLNWIALRSRPDIAWATSRAASLITHDADLCFVRVKHICQYLQYTLSYALRYASNTSNIQSKSYGFSEMPPLRRQGRRASKELLSIMVSLLTL